MSENKVRDPRTSELEKEDLRQAIRILEGNHDIEILGPELRVIE